VKLVVLGLTLSSSWGNGHATTYRALLRALAARGHAVLFLERDVPWYAAHRDLADPDFCRLALYRDLADLEHWRGEIAQADAVMIGSYVPDGIAVADLVLDTAGGMVTFYDIDTPVTLAALARGEESYVAKRQIPRFARSFSFTGGPMLDVLRTRYGAPSPVALYCSVDPAQYRPLPSAKRWDLSYLGTYSADRQPALERLLLDVARRAPERRFMVAGPQYPADVCWPANVERLEHVPPAEHPAFYAASRFTLNITRSDMIAAGYSPSVRLFEAAACRTAIISDFWLGLDTLFGTDEIVIARSASDVLRALALEEPRRDALAEAAHARILAGHTSAHRAAQLEHSLSPAKSRIVEPTRK
jgi:spore maturation protein CgeB